MYICICICIYPTAYSASTLGCPRGLKLNMSKKEHIYKSSSSPTQICIRFLPQAFPIRYADSTQRGHLSSLPQRPPVSHLCTLFILISYYTLPQLSLFAVLKHPSSF